MRVFSTALLLLNVFSVSADAEVHICTESGANADCYVNFAIWEPINGLYKDARFAQSVELEVSPDGRPLARVGWRLTADGAVVPGNIVDENLPVAMQQALVANFRTNIPKIVCGPQTLWNSEGQFVRSGGIISYSLYLSWEQKTTVTISSCEAL